MTLSMQPFVSGWETGLAKKNTHCSYCALQCALRMTVDVARNLVTKVRGRRDFPTTRGLSCVKGQTAHEQLSHPERLLHPLIRDREGTLRKASWSDALSLMAEKFKSIQGTHGKNSAAVFGSGALTNETLYLLGKFARVALRTANIDYNGRYCMSSAAAAQNAAFGLDRGLHFPLSDLTEAKCVLLVGANVGECLPPILTFLKRAKKRGAKIIVADPRLTDTSRLADLHLKIRPGGDLGLALALLGEVRAQGGVDRDFLRERTSGFEETLASVEAIDASWGATQTGVPADQIRQAAQWLSTIKPSLVLTGRGAEQHSKGVDTVQAFINLALCLGHVGKPSGGFGTLTGQGNGQGGREQGQKADQLPGYRSIENPEHRRQVAEAWGVPEAELPGKGLSAQELFQAVERQEVRSLWVVASNPAVSSPNNNRIREALARMDFLAVSDIFLSETAELAQVVLPATAFAEEDGTMTNLEGRCVVRRAVVTSPGETRPDWKVLQELARLLGRGEFFGHATVEDVFNEMARVTSGARADYSGMNYNKLERNKGLFWPCPSPEHPGTPRLFQDGFSHPDGKARLRVTPWRESAEEPDAEYPYRFTTGRVLEHYLSGNQTRRIKVLSDAVPSPYVEVAGSVARDLGLREEDKVVLTSRRGKMSLAVRIKEDQEPSTLFVPFHWGGEKGANQLTQEALDPVSRMPEFKTCAVNLVKEK
jgi:assimilatory nitrate reductase catalytic subunit